MCAVRFTSASNLQDERRIHEVQKDENELAKNKEAVPTARAKRRGKPLKKLWTKKKRMANTKQNAVEELGMQQDEMTTEQGNGNSGGPQGYYDSLLVEFKNYTAFKILKQLSKRT